MDETIKPCAHCGGMAQWWIFPADAYGDVLHGVLCQSFRGICHSSVRGYATKEEAIAAWNRRTSPWTKVADRPPTEHEEVLVYWTPWLGKVGSQGVAVYIEGTWYNPVNGGEIAAPSYWAPLLPDPPKEAADGS